MAARLVLGSASPRRSEILKRMHLPADIIHAADIDETPHKGELPHLYAVRVAADKNAVLAPLYPHDYIVTADTTCAVGRRILGKPEDRDDAKRMITLLSGRAHHVYTGVAVRAPDGRVVTRLSDNRVKVKRLSAEEITLWLDSNEWIDKTAGVKIQGLFSRFIIHTSGTESGILGLPAFDVVQMLHGLGYQSPPTTKEE